MNYPSYYHNAISSVIADSPNAREYLAKALKRYRNADQKTEAKKLRKHIYWIGYPNKR